MRFTIILAFALTSCSLLIQNCPAQGLEGDETTPNVRATIFATGVRRYDQKHWAVVGIHGQNWTKEDAVVSVNLHIGSDSQTKYTRTFWMPAESERRTWLPFKLPGLDRTASQFIANTTVIVRQGGEQKLHRTHDPSIEAPQPLIVNQQPTQTAAILDGRDPFVTEGLDEQIPDHDVGKLVGIARELISPEATVINLRERHFPPYPYAYDGLDHLVIASDRILDDSAASATFRSWLNNGGKAWIMLDQVSPATVRALVGSDVCYEEVDRVELTEFQLNTPRLALENLEPLETWRSERAVEFVRVLTTSEPNVLTWIDEWPAAFTLRQGNGEVLFTTLHADGWHHHTEAHEDPPGGGIHTHGETRAIANLSALFLTAKPEARISTTEIKPVLQAEIGYEIPSRSFAALILGANCLLLLIAGVVLAKRQQLEHAAWVLPTLGIIATCMMVGVGMANSNGVPPTAAGFTLMEVSSQTDEVQATRFTSFYSPKSQELPLSSTETGLVLPELTALEGTQKRAVWDDVRNSYWQGLPVSAKTQRFVQSHDRFELSERITASATFGPDGLDGEITSQALIGEASDVIVKASVAPGIAIEVRDDGTFSCPDDQLLAPGQYISGSILTSDQQRRRQEIYRSLLDPRDKGAQGQSGSQDTPYPTEPMLFLWGDRPQSVGHGATADFEHRDATLWAVPLDIQRTPAKSRFSVPATFLVTDYAGGRFPVSNFYNPNTGVWLKEVTSHTTSIFRFSLPTQVIPCELSTASITMKVVAPSRKVALLALDSTTNEIVELKSWQSPSGVLTHQITDTHLLQLDEGGLIVGVLVSKTENQEELQSGPKSLNHRDNFERNTWEIDYLRINVAGEKLP